MNEKKVLVADDDPNIVELIEESLTPYNYEVIKADNGYSALYKAKEEMPGLIILDLILPRLDGVKTCLRLKESTLTKNIPILILSGNTKKDTVIQLLKLGIKNYLAKPFDVNELIKRVNATFSKNSIKSREDMSLRYRLKVSGEILNVVLKGKFDKGDEDILINDIEGKISEGIKKVIINLIELETLGVEEIEYLEKIVNALKEYNLKVKISAGDSKSLRYNLLKNSSIGDYLLNY